MENEANMETLNSLGFGFPQTSEEISLFREAYNDFDFKANPSKIDPNKILKSIRKPSTQVTKTDFHKRTVLAAEIVFQLHKEWTMGHLKLQKLIYLCQNALNMSVHTNFLRQAMGPYDPALKRSLESQFKKNKWFEFRSDSKQKFWPLEKVGEHRTWYERYFNNEQDSISNLLVLFKNMKSDRVELIATLYSCWAKAIEKGEMISNDLLVKRVYEWSPEKEKFTRKDILEAIDWMNQNQIYPRSYS